MPGVGSSLPWLLLWSAGSRAAGFSRCSMWAQELQLPGSRAQAQKLWCASLAVPPVCAIFPDQGSSPCLLHWQADSLPVSHQGSPEVSLEIILYLVLAGAWEAGREGHNEFNPYRKKEICPPSSLANPPPRDNLTNLLVCVCPCRLSPYSLYVGIVKVAQSCPTLCDPMDYTVHGIFQARILEWVAFPFSRGSSQPRDRTQVSCFAGGFFTN